MGVARFNMRALQPACVRACVRWIRQRNRLYVRAGGVRERAVPTRFTRKTGRSAGLARPGSVQPYLPARSLLPNSSASTTVIFIQPYVAPMQKAKYVHGVDESSTEYFGRHHCSFGIPLLTG
jgi:hypothetical protein